MAAGPDPGRDRERAARLRRRRMFVRAGIGGVALLLVAAIAVTLVTRPDPLDVPSSSDYGVSIGDADAPRTLIVYEDFLCPGCGALEAATGARLAELAADGRVRVDYRPFTLLDRFGTYSARAVAAFGVVKASSGDEVAKEFHDLLYADQPAEDAEEFPDAGWLIEKAVEAGATEADVRPGIEAGENDFSDAATAEAEAAGVNSTPTIVLDGEQVTYSDYDDLIDDVS